jgi:hypothetical protein
MWRQTVVQKWIFKGKSTLFPSKFDKSGDSQAFVTTVVLNVATERIWLDTTELGDT